MDRVQALPDERRRFRVCSDGAHEPHTAGVPGRLQLLARRVVQ